MYSAASRGPFVERRGRDAGYEVNRCSDREAWTLNCVPRPYETFRLCLFGVEGALRSGDAPSILKVMWLRFSALFVTPKVVDTKSEVHRLWGRQPGPSALS